MKLSEPLLLPDLLGYINDIACDVHIRMALTRSEGSNRWQVRSLVVDVFPDNWLDDAANPLNVNMFTEYNPPRELPLRFHEHTIFLRQMVWTQFIKDWLTEPNDCRLSNFDPTPGYHSQVLRFSLPEFLPELAGQRIWSRRPDGFAVLPWPHYLYWFTLQGGNAYHRGDFDPLFVPGHHYDNLRDARGQLIHGFSDTELRTYNDRDQIAVRVIDDDGWIHSVHKMTEDNSRLAIEVRGRKLFPGYLIVKRNGATSFQEKFSGPGSISVRVPDDVSQFTFILANEARELDRASYPPNSSSTSAPLAWQALVRNEEPPEYVTPLAAMTGQLDQPVAEDDEEDDDESWLIAFSTPMLNAKSAPNGDSAQLAQEPAPLNLPTVSSDSAKKPVRVFISYSHKDDKLRHQLETHLDMLKRRGIIDAWSDRKIGAGQDFDIEISKQLDQSQVILLLISSDFLRSDYCYDKEVARALEMHHAGTARVIPIILRPSDWHDAPFGKLVALPKDGKPVTKWSNRDEAWLDVSKGIRNAVLSLDLGASGSSGPSTARDEG